MGSRQAPHDGHLKSLAAKAAARRAEAMAARRQASACSDLAQACRERARALRATMQADQELALYEEGSPRERYAREDGERAGRLATLLDKQAERYEREAARNRAEAMRAETEADTAHTRALVVDSQHTV
jgi:hypothetical protein